MFFMHTHAFEYVPVHKSNYIHVQGLEVTILSASANLGICSYVLPNFGIYLGTYFRGIHNFEDTWGYFLCHSQLWDLLEYFGDYMGVCSYVIHNFGIYLGEIPMVFTKLGITWGNVPTLFTILEFT